MIRPPGEMGGFEFAVLAGLRVAQLTRGCLPRVDGGDHTKAVIAQLEVAEGKIRPVVNVTIPVPGDRQAA